MDRNSLRELWEKRLKKGFLKCFRRDNLIIMVLAGILLFVIALPTGSGRKAAETDENAAGEIQKQLPETVGTADDADAGSVFPRSDYETIQEEKLKRLLSGMENVGDVEVMLTFVSSGEQVVEKEEPVARSSTVEQDSEGGTRTITSYEKGDSTVYQGKEGQPFVTEVLHPRVEGVLVIAEGAGDGRVSRSITEAVQALFGVEAHRVKVLPMKNKHISQAGLIQ